MLAQYTYRTTAQLGAYIDECIFPCSRAEILCCAEENEAPDAILDAIESIPDDCYHDVREIVSRIVGQA